MRNCIRIHQEWLHLQGFISYSFTLIFLPPKIGHIEFPWWLHSQRFHNNAGEWLHNKYHHKRTCNHHISISTCWMPSLCGTCVPQSRWVADVRKACSHPHQKKFRYWKIVWLLCCMYSKRMSHSVEIYCVYRYLEPKWPLFWLEKALFWWAWPAKIEVNGALYIYIYTHFPDLT